MAVAPATGSGITGMSIWPEIDDQMIKDNDHWLWPAVRPTNTSEAVYMLTAVSVWPGAATRQQRGPSNSVTRCAGPASNGVPALLADTHIMLPGCLRGFPAQIDPVRCPQTLCRKITLKRHRRALAGQVTEPEHQSLPLFG
jgi:hypothetical protein